MKRNEAIKRIRAALKRRSGKSWSVTGGTGTAWGWITINAPPKRRTWHWISRSDIPANGGEQDMGEPHGGWRDRDTGEPHGHIGPADRAELAELLGLSKVPLQGMSIPASSAQEYVDRAEGRMPTVTGTQYWD